MRTKLFIAALLLAGLSLLGQTLGDITGQVGDPSGAGVPNSVVTLTNPTTNAVRQASTNEQGLYSFPSVPPGIYNLKVEHPGFKTTTSNVEVQVQQTVRLDITLQVGEVSQTVEVSAAASLLQAENATLGTVVSNASIVELPLNGREYLNLVALNSNTNTLSPPAGQAQSRQGGDRSNQSISAGGNRIFFDYFTLDGVINTDPDFNTYVVLPSIDAIQEFKVQTGVYPAEFGHGATQINVLTKSGGNVYHGALFEFLRNDDMDANNSYAFTANRPIKSPFRWNDYGYELDGPVRIPTALRRPEQIVSSCPILKRWCRRRVSKPSTPCRRPPCSKATTAPGRPPSTTRLSEDPLPQQHHSGEPDQSDLAGHVEVLRHPHSAGLREQLHPVQLDLRSTATASSSAWISSNPRNHSGAAVIAGVVKFKKTAV